MKGRRQLSGMTLIELILVMGLLAVVLGISAPVLSGFVKGRKLQEEARRFLALTRYGRSEAISRGVCMELRIDMDARKYGIYPQVEYGSGARPPVEFDLPEGFSVELVEEEKDLTQKADIRSGKRVSLDASINRTLKSFENLGKETEQREKMIRFWPDGMIDEESPENVRIVGEGEDALRIHLVDLFSGYEIQNEEEDV